MLRILNVELAGMDGSLTELLSSRRSVSRLCNFTEESEAVKMKDGPREMMSIISRYLYIQSTTERRELF